MPRWDLVYKWADPETESLVDAVASALENCDAKLQAALAASPEAAGLSAPSTREHDHESCPECIARIAAEGKHAIAVYRQSRHDATASASGEPPPLDLWREIVRNGVPPDAMMDSTPAGQNLRRWWLEQWAPTLQKVRDRLAAAYAKTGNAGEADER